MKIRPSIGRHIRIGESAFRATFHLSVQRIVKREWPLIITHSFHVKITLQYYISSEKENEGTQA